MIIGDSGRTGTEKYRGSRNAGITGDPRSCGDTVNTQCDQ